MPEPLYAHTRPGRPPEEWELLAEHLAAVAKRAAGFARPFGAGEPARVSGLLHDIGKVSARFLAYLHGTAASTDLAAADKLVGDVMDRLFPGRVGDYYYSSPGVSLGVGVGSGGDWGLGGGLHF